MVSLPSFLGRPLLVAGLCLGLAARPEAARASDADEPGGFRMASDPKIVTVFGDSKQFRSYVDRFYELHGQMTVAREAFHRNVQAVLRTLVAHREAKTKKCPADAVAMPYAKAFHLAETFHQLGKELEAKRQSIAELDGLGETALLTPDYRWKVARALKLYAEVVRDFKEMRTAFQEQLAGELTFSGCDAAKVIALGDEMEESGATPPSDPLPAPVKPKGKAKEPELPPVGATPATFFIDNTGCDGALRIYLDGALVGDVASKAKAAFRAPAGRHDMCLIPATSPQSCGDPGTLRSSYIHDGWSIVLRCD
jgi:hypothetical protein